MQTIERKYLATVIRVIDGDTIFMDVDLGFTIRSQMYCRLLGINCNELDQPLGPEARDFVKNLLPEGTVVVVTSVKADKYAKRFDGVVTMDDGTELASRLLDAKLAVVWDGTGKRPIVPSPAA